MWRALANLSIGTHLQASHVNAFLLLYTFLLINLYFFIFFNHVVAIGCIYTDILVIVWSVVLCVCVCVGGGGGL